MANDSIHIQKGISIGHLVATIGLIIAGFAFIYDLREQLAIADVRIESLESRLDRVVERNDDQFGAIMDNLLRLESKIDKVLVARGED